MVVLFDSSQCLLVSFTVVICSRLFYCCCSLWLAFFSSSVPCVFTCLCGCVPVSCSFFLAFFFFQQENAARARLHVQQWGVDLFDENAVLFEPQHHDVPFHALYPTRAYVGAGALSLAHCRGGSVEDCRWSQHRIGILQSNFHLDFHQVHTSRAGVL